MNKSTFHTAPLWRTALISSGVAAASLLFSQWLLKPASLLPPEGRRAAATGLSANASAVMAMAGTPNAQKSALSAPEQMMPEVKASGNSSQLKAPAASQPDSETQSASSSYTESAVPVPTPTAADRVAAARRIQERVRNGEAPTVAEFEAAGIHMSEEFRQSVISNESLKEPIGSKPPATSGSDPESPSGRTGTPAAATNVTEITEVLADAFQEVVPAWADVKESLRIPVPRPTADDAVPEFSGIRPEYMRFKRSLFEVNTGREITKLPAEFSSDRSLISADGRYIVRFRDLRGSRVPVMYVHKAEKPDEVLRLECSRYRTVQYVQLLTSRHILVHGDTSSGQRWTIWNIENGQEASTFNTGEDSGLNCYCVSPSGSKFAVWSFDNGGRIYNLLNGQIDARLASPRSGERGRYMVKSLSFSPDGKEIAAVLYPSQIAVWSIDGKLLQHEFVPNTGYSFSLDEAGVWWLPDSSGWLVGDRMLVDRKTSSAVWEIKRNRGDSGRGLLARVLSQDQVLVMRGEDESREMMPVRIPWEKIREKLKPIRFDEPVDLKPGSMVSLQVNVGEVRSATRDEVGIALKAAAANVLQTSGFDEAQDQPVRLLLRHNEVVEEDRLRGGMLSILAGSAQSSERARDTKVTITVEVQNSKTGDIYWTHTVQSNGLFHVRGDVTEQSLRAAAFENAVQELERILLPSRLFPGNREGFPIQSSVP